MKNKTDSSQVMLMLILLCGIYILSYFSRLCPAVIAIDISSSLNIDLQKVSLFSAATMLSYGLAQLPSGLLADAVGGKKAIIILGLLAVVGSFIFSFSTHVSIMASSRFLTGIGVAITVPALTLLARNISPERYGRASSIFLSCGGIGGIIAAPPLLFLSDVFGWRTALLFFTVLTFIFVLLIFFYIKDEKPALKEVKTKKSMREVCCEIGRNLKQVFGTPAFWVLGLWNMFTVGSFFTLSAMWWGPYFVEGCGFTKLQSSYVMTAASLTLLISQPIMGYLSDTVFKCRKKPIVIGSILGIITVLPYALFTGDLPFIFYIFQSIAMILCIGSVTPLVYTMAKESFPLQLTGTVIGCLNMLNPLWASLMQNIFGNVLELTQSWGFTIENAFNVAMWLIVINYIIAAGISFFMKETFSYTIE